MTDISHIGFNIRKLREKKGLTQRALADSVFVSFQAISAWERGLSVPDLENAMRLARYFGVSVDALLSKTGQEYFVGIDGDSTKTEFVLFETDGRVVRVERLPGANPNDRDLEHTVSVLSRGLEQLLGNLVPVAVFVGIAGASQSDYRKAIATRLSQSFHTRVQVDWDAANVLSMGADPENSIAVVCGTGSCVYVRKGNRQYHYGGWGQLFDLAGSAYDVGRDAIRYTLSVEDGLAEHNALSQRVLEALGGGAFDQISTIYKKGSSYIADFAQIVLELAQQKEPTANQILQTNANRLSQLIQTAIQHHGTPVQIMAAGSFLKNELFREMVQNQVGVKLVIPEVSAVYGACVEALRMQNIPVSQSFYQTFAESYRIL